MPIWKFKKKYNQKNSVKYEKNGKSQTNHLTEESVNATKTNEKIEEPFFTAWALVNGRPIRPPRDRRSPISPIPKPKFAKKQR